MEDHGKCFTEANDIPFSPLCMVAIISTKTMIRLVRHDLPLVTPHYLLTIFEREQHTHMLPVPYKKLTLSPSPRRTFQKLTISHLGYLTQMTRKDKIEMEPCIIGLLGKKSYTSRPYIWHCTEAKICEKIKMLKPKSP